MYDAPHRRFNPLTREWILVSPQRARRPWQGQVEPAQGEQRPEYDPDCYLCPGNQRAGGVVNPQYRNTFVFDNDFPAILYNEPADGPQPAVPAANPSHRLFLETPDPGSLFTAEPENGICRVICFTPRHDQTLPQLSLDEVESVINTWSEQVDELQRLPGIAYVQVFENKGAMMGCSNPHPHSQIWSQSRIPTEVAKELASQRDYFIANRSPLLLDYLAQEQQRGERIVAANQHFTALVPFWATWPFELLLIAHRAAPDLPSFSQDERRALGDIIRRVTTRYDNLFRTSFPYSMGFHQAPNDSQDHPEWVLHAHFYPPLLRSATVRKFMVGYEMLGMPQRDITPEAAAAQLRALPETHYTEA
jgi:UDPglucose--hexose-1-phosphate uridylyltransferase